MDSRKIGERLRLMRGEKSREEVAMAVGVTSSAIYNYEKGTRIPGDRIKIRLAEYFEKSIQDIFFAE